MSFLASKPIKDSTGEKWRVATDGKNSVFQKLVPVPSDHPTNKSFATWGGQVPTDVKVQSNNLTNDDFARIG